MSCLEGGLADEIRELREGLGGAVDKEEKKQKKAER